MTHFEPFKTQQTGDLKHRLLAKYKHELYQSHTRNVSDICLNGLGHFFYRNCLGALTWKLANTTDLGKQFIKNDSPFSTHCELQI